MIPLKRSLAELDVSYNPTIDDDAVPALLALTKLHFLSFRDTSISLAGVRRLARTLKEQEREMDVEVPHQCEVYIGSAFLHRARHSARTEFLTHVFSYDSQS